MKNVERRYYDLNPSQNVSKLQCQYTLFKRVINILFSAKRDEEIDFKVMEKAFNILVERNDCLRIQFVKKDKKLMQYFRDKVEFNNIPILKFQTEKEQSKFVNKLSKSAIKYMKGKVIEPYFIKTFDNKYMVFIKVCHMVVDIYGINFIFNDLFDIYDCLINNTELPPAPNSFEEVVQKDLQRKENTYRHQEHVDFFTDYISSHEEPWYAGIHGPKEKYWNKQLKKNKRAQKMFFIKNDTVCYQYNINEELMKKAMDFCESKNITPTNLFFYACSLCTSFINNKINSMLPLQLCNCRGTSLDKNCAGTKVQSIGCFTDIDFNKTILENLSDFSETQMKLYRRIHFPDQDFEMMLHKIYPSTMLETYYSITFSFIPYLKRKDITYNLYSNGKGALPCYIALLYDINNNITTIGYDVHKKTISKEDVDNFHKKYLELLNYIIDNPDLKINEYEF